MTTEAEAKTKWCPMGRSLPLRQYGGAGQNRGYSEDNWTYCIGSACMMWRVTPGHSDGGGGYRPSGHGYCGLAGKPWSAE